jgi:hypothetical protein
VRAETAAAVAAGTIPRGEAPSTNVPGQGFNSLRSRADVNAEAVVAVREGRIARGDQTFVEAPVFVASRTRAEVKAETLAAIRLGLIPHGELASRDATPAENEQIRLAGERARTVNTLAAR